MSDGLNDCVIEDEVMSRGAGCGVEQVAMFSVPKLRIEQ
jgi:hypothetical protein